MSLRNKIALGALYFLLNVVGFGIFTQSLYAPTDLTTPMRAACRIVSTGGGEGSGVLLSTGYVLTSAHLVDYDMNGKIGPMERYLAVEFFDPQIVYTGRVQYLGRLGDYALLELDEAPERPGLTFQATQPKPGQEVFSIGCIRGQRPIPFRGYMGYIDRGQNRISCYASGGNSGGPILNASGDVIGITRAIYQTRERLKVNSQVELEGSVWNFTTYTNIPLELNGVSIYVPTSTMYVDLLIKNLTCLVRPSVHNNFSYLPYLLKTILQLAVFFAFLFYVRSHLLH